VGKWPDSVAFTPDGTRAYVVNVMSNDISIIATATHQVLAIIPLNRESFDNKINKIKRDSSNRFFKFIDGLFLLLPYFQGMGERIRVAITPDGIWAYVVSTIGDNVSVINIATQKVLVTIPIQAPSSILLPSYPFRTSKYRAKLPIDCCIT
jgi:YVTN family beta-propeller protein